MVTKNGYLLPVCSKVLYLLFEVVKLLILTNGFEYKARNPFLEYFDIVINIFKCFHVIKYIIT